MMKIGGLDQNHWAVAYAVRVTLYVSPLLLWVVGQTTSWLLAAGLLAAMAVLLWRNFDYDFRQFPLLIQLNKKMIVLKRKLKPKIFKEISIDYIEFGVVASRFGHSFFPFFVFCFFCFVFFREFDQRLFYNIVINNSVFIDLLIPLYEIQQDHDLFLLDKEPYHPDTLKILSESEDFYFSHSPHFILVEINVILLNSLICLIFFEVFQISIFIKNFVYVVKNKTRIKRNKYYYFIYCIFMLFFAVTTIIFFSYFAISTSMEKYPSNYFDFTHFITYPYYLLGPPFFFMVVVVGSICWFEYLIAEILFHKHELLSFMVFEPDTGEWVWYDRGRK